MHTQQQEGTYSAMVVVPAGIVVEQDFNDCNHCSSSSSLH